jgi:hypothetical protein
MPVDAFIFKLLLLSIPGFLAFTIYKKTAVSRRESKSQFGFSGAFIVIICSLASCILYDLFVTFINMIFKTDYATTLNNFIDVKMYTAKELAILCIIAIILGFLFSLFESKKIINHIAFRLKITEYYGDTDVWTSFCANKNAGWIYIRDHKQKLTYYGNLKQYSDPGEDRELLLTDVQVFSEDGEYCYYCPTMYICRQSDDITLEIPLNREGETKWKNPV